MSSSSAPKAVARSRQALEYLQIRGFYTTAYARIVQPERVFAVTDYFRRYWVPLLKPGPAWLVVALRQHCYRNGQRSWCEVGRQDLAEENGVAVRTVDNYLDLPLVQWFIAGRQARYRQTPEGQKQRTKTRYSLRLDEPLTPQHQAGLAALAREMADGCEAEAPVERAREIAQKMLDLDTEAFWQHLQAAPAGDLPAEPLTVQQIVEHVAGVADGPKPSEADRLEIAHTCDALTRRVIRPDKVIIGSQYFRTRWLPLLGAARAWLILFLRARCYLNAEQLEVRDTCRVAGHAELAAALGVSISTIKVCLSEWPAPAFLEHLATHRPGTGQIQMVYRVEMIDPLIPGDRARYAELAGQEQESEFSEAQTQQELDFAAVLSGQELEFSHDLDRQQPKSATSPLDQKLDFAFLRVQGPKFAADPGREQPEFATIEESGKSQNLQNSQILFNTSDLENTQHHQVLIRRPGEALPLAAAAGPLPAILQDLNIQEPSVSRILKKNPPAVDVLAWVLEAQARDGIENKPGFIVSMLLDGYEPPATLARLVSLTVAEWRALVGAVRETQAAGRVEVPAALAADFQTLYRCLGHLDPEDWPIILPVAVPEPVRLPEAENRRPAPKDGTLAEAQAAWAEALRALQWQLDRSTFQAWFKHTRVTGVAGDAWTIGVANPRGIDWLRKRLRPAIERAVKWTVGREIALEFEVAAGEGAAPGNKR